MGNALFGVGDYLTQPIVMLLAAPYLLHHLGLSEYGLWMLITATVTTTGFVSTGFGDATLKYASKYRAGHNGKKVEEALRVAITINLVLGGMLALLIWYGSPYAVHSLFKIDSHLQPAGITAFRIGSATLLVRSVESVFISALRAYERYGPAVQVSVLSRVAAVVCACILASRGYGVVEIMMGTFFVAAAAAGLQSAAVGMVVGPISLWPSFNMTALSEVAGFGCFSWLQAVAGCFFNQADRLLIGALLSTSAVAYYSICIQAAQPIHGLIAASLHFLFPHMSARLSTCSAPELRSVVLSVLRINLAAAALLCIPLSLLSRDILNVWMGAAFAQHTWMLLSIVAVAYGFLALNITGHYALLALGQVRLVSLLNIAGGAVTLIATLILAPRSGLIGAAAARLLYGPITWFIYIRLRSMLSAPELPQTCISASLAITGPRAG